MSIDSLFRDRAERGVARGPDEVLAQARTEASPQPQKHRAAPPRSRRRIAVAVAAGAMVVAGTGVWLTTRSSPEQVQAGAETDGTPTPDQDAAAATPSAQATPDPSAPSFAHEEGQLPRLVINRPGFVIESGGQWTTPRLAGSGSVTTAPLETTPITLIQNTPDGWAGETLLLRHQGPRWVLDGDPIDANGLPRAQIARSSAVTVLGWTEDDTDVVMFGVNVSEGDMIDIARSVNLAPNGELTLTDPPGYMTVGVPNHPDPIISAEYEYQLDDGVRGDLHIQSAAWWDFHDDVLGLLSETDDFATTQLGQTQVILAATEDRRLRALWWAQGLTFELRTIPPEGQVASLDLIAGLVADIAVADDETWARVVPNDWTPPEDRDATVDFLLQDIPVPEDFDIEWLKTIVAPGDPYQMAATVTGQIACAWIDQWINATTETEREHAVTSMATSQDWAALTDIADAGGYADLVWQYADAISRDGTITAGTELTVEESYTAALGCLERQ